MKVRELRGIHGTQQSFYNKAFINEDNENTQYLYSYYSLIVTNYGNAIKFEEVINLYSNQKNWDIIVREIELKFEEDINLYSNATMSRVRKYLRQIGRWDLAALLKANLFKKLDETNYIVLDIL